MVRTQIQLTEKQVDSLRKMAERRHTSMAEVIRQAIDHYAQIGEVAGSEEARRRAMAAAGRFSSGVGDLAERHDDYLADAYRP